MRFKKITINNQIHFILNKPEYLYCYFEASRGIEFLQTLKFRLSSIADFNDPFESLFRTDYPHFFISATEDLTDSEISQRIACLNEKELMVCSNRVRNKLHGRINFIKGLRVGCFSEVNNSILMWSHYGRKFTGIVVKFRVSMSDWGNDLIKVDYNDEIISVSEFNENAFGAGPEERSLVKRKSSVWSYEQEWRYVKPSTECDFDSIGAYRNIKSDAIIGIIVGCRISQKKLKDIENIVTQKFNNKVDMYVAIPNGYQYLVDIKDLSSIRYSLDFNSID